ncbi:MAG: glycosyltransferase [Thermoplasmatota archaeon]
MDEGQEGGSERGGGGESPARLAGRGEEDAAAQDSGGGGTGRSRAGRRDDCAALVLNHNGEALLAAALDSLFSQTVVPRVVVIDNASTDRSREIVRERFPAAELLENAENLDFGAAYNRAIRERRERYICVLNNDIVLEPDCMERALAFLDSTPSAGAAVFTVFDMDERVEFPYERDYIVKPRFGLDLGTRVRFESRDSPPHYMRYIWGGGSIVRRELFDVIEFDEDFGWYWEDADFGWMMVNATGLWPAAVAGAIVHHIGGASVRRRFDPREINLRDHRNSLLSFSKNATRWELLRTLPQRTYFFLKQPDKVRLWRDMRRKRREGAALRGRLSSSGSSSC